jgi:hypothetical protein
MSFYPTIGMTNPIKFNAALPDNKTGESEFREAFRKAFKGTEFEPLADVIKTEAVAVVSQASTVPEVMQDMRRLGRYTVAALAEDGIAYTVRWLKDTRLDERTVIANAESFARSLPRDRELLPPIVKPSGRGQFILFRIVRSKSEPLET